MKVLILSIALLASCPAWAHQCPGQIATLDRLLAQNPPSDKTLEAQVRELRNQGKQAHDKGQHEQAVSLLQQALDLLQRAE